MNLDQPEWKSFSVGTYIAEYKEKDKKNLRNSFVSQVLNKLLTGIGPVTSALPMRRSTA